MSPARLYLICGLPGAGKTTRSKQIESAHRAIRLCTDEWLDALGISLVDYPPRFRLEPYLLGHAEQLLRAGVSVIVEFASWSRVERDRIREVAARTGVPCELHFLDAPLLELERRVRARGGPHATAPSRATSPCTVWAPTIAASSSSSSATSRKARSASQEPGGSASARRIAVTASISAGELVRAVQLAERYLDEALSNGSRVKLQQLRDQAKAAIAVLGVPNVDPLPFTLRVA